MFEAELQRRIDLTCSCRDADAIAKVDDAGAIVQRDGVWAQVMHNGVLVERDCYYGPWMTELVGRLRGHHEPQEEAAFHAVMERLRADPPARPVMVELGSYWAYYSLWFAHVLPAAQLILVEPDAAHLDVGRRNLALNDVAGSFVEAAVAADDGGRVELLRESDRQPHCVDVVSVDGLIERARLDHVDVLLCDAQGAELRMLDGARAALRSGRVRFVVVSTHHHSICGDPLIHERCLRALAALGAHVVVEHSVAESFSGDGLIVASTDPRDRDLALTLSHARARDSLFGGLEPELAAAHEQRDALRADNAALRAEYDALRASYDDARRERAALLAERAASRAPAERLARALARRLRQALAGQRRT